MPEVLKQTESLRARRIDEKSENGPRKPAVAPPPDMAVLGEWAAFNEMKKK